MGFSTDCIHAGQHPDPITGAVMPPIYQTSTYVQRGLGDHTGYEYARTQNPTREALERCVAALEGGNGAVAFSSGMAAIDSVTNILDHGDHVIVTENTYGGTYRLFEQVTRNHGLEFSYVDTTDLDAVRAAVLPETRMIFIETPTNPVLAVTDLAACVQIAAEQGETRVVVDNTFMSPALQRPLDSGVDIVLHSSTKYLNGHSDMVGGVVVANEGTILERLRFLQNAVGAVPGPMDCWLCLRGIKTLALRMKVHEENGRALAAWLNDHPKIEKVYYPGLPDHPGHQLASSQQKGFGGMIAFDTGSLKAARRVMENTAVFSLAESLGGVESLISHPASMTHGSVPKEERDRMGITDGLVRISVGCEDLEDLQADLEQALG
jgi:cystathionine gamma-lyase/cystathionine beta-lyase/cystathionine gamma-lyase/homocysteine desulfhydrase